MRLLLHTSCRFPATVNRPHPDWLHLHPGKCESVCVHWLVHLSWTLFGVQIFFLLSFEGIEGENREGGQAPEKEREYEPRMKKKIRQNFFPQRLLPLSLLPSLPSLFSHLPLFSSPCYFLLRSTPRRAALLGGSPPSAALVPPHAGNNSHPPKDPELLEGSASRRTSLHLPPPPAVSSGRRGSLLHVPCAHLFPPLVPGWRAVKMQTEDKENESVCPEWLHMGGKWMEKERRQGRGPYQVQKIKNSPQHSSVHLKSL